MKKLHSHHDINSPRETIWQLLIDFGNIERWWPKGEIVDIERVVLDGSGPGMTRHIYNVGFEGAISERLDSIDYDNYSYQLSIVGERPAGLLHYQATGKLTVIDDNTCRLTYDSEYIVEEGREEEAEGLLLLAYELMYRGLDNVNAASSQ